MENVTFTDYDTALINYILDNRHKSKFFIVNVASVSTSGMSRKMRFHIVRDGAPVNVTYLFARILRANMTKDDCIRVSGCGMDMIHHALASFMRAIGAKDENALASVNNYHLA